MRFSDQFLDEIRDRLPISSVVGEHVVWDKRKSQPARGDYWACCPFHGEKTPSFHADDRRGRYHCFGCGVSGDHFRFLTERAGMSFPEAVENLARRAGVPMPARDERAEAEDRKRQTLTDVMELAAHYFEEALAANVGAPVRGYLNRREVRPEMRERFRLGFAPDSRNGLKEFLAQNGVSAEAMDACGLVIAREDVAVPYDRFRNRLMFPITDTRGRIIAFGGRAMSDDMPAKYLNSPETQLFSKRRVLYNAQAARTAAAGGQTLIVVEGYMDVIALASAGFEAAVAPLGTALTEEHVTQLWRMSPEPVLAFDGDEAGQRAAGRSMDMILPHLQPGHSVRILTLPDGQDPDDIVRTGGREAFAGLIERAQPLAEALWSRATRGQVFEAPEKRAALEAELRALAGQIGDQSVRRHYLQAFEERVNAWFRPQRQGRGDGRSTSPGSRGASWRGVPSPRTMVSEGLKNSRLLRSGPASIPPREAAIVMCLVNHPALAEAHYESLLDIELTGQTGQEVVGAVLEAVGEVPDIDAADLRARLTEAGHAGAISGMEAQLARQGVWQAGADVDRSDAETGLRHALALHYKSVRLNRELKAAEMALGTDPSEESFERLRDIQNQISSVDGTEALIEGFGSLSGRSARGF